MGVKNTKDVENSIDLLNVFERFYKTIGHLPLPNGLLTVPDGDAPPGEDRVNMKSLYEMFRHTNSHGLCHFWGLFNIILMLMILHKLKMLWLNYIKTCLINITLSGAREFEFSAVSDLVARISYLIKAATLAKKDQTEKTDVENAYKINEWFFCPHYWKTIRCSNRHYWWGHRT